MIRAMISCPETGALVSTGLDMRQASSLDQGRAAFHCPACGQLHRWELSEAVLEGSGRRPGEPQKAALAATR